VHRVTTPQRNRFSSWVLVKSVISWIAPVVPLDVCHMPRVHAPQPKWRVRPVNATRGTVSRAGVCVLRESDGKRQGSLAGVGGEKYKQQEAMPVHEVVVRS